MLHYIKSKQDLDSLRLKLPQGAEDELLRCVAYPGEGLALIAEDAQDICEARKFVDFETHPAEWVNRLDGGFLAALYAKNNSFTVSLFLSSDIAPDVILQELED